MGKGRREKGGCFPRLAFSLDACLFGIWTSLFDSSATSLQGILGIYSNSHLGLSLIAFLPLLLPISFSMDETTREFRMISPLPSFHFPPRHS